MDTLQELEKSKACAIVNLVEYAPHRIISNTIIHKITGHVIISSLDEGETLGGKSSSFDHYIYIIDGRAEIIIDNIKHSLGSGDGIVIPANATHNFHAKEKFKMICTVIKSGYEGN